MAWQLHDEWLWFQHQQPLKLVCRTHHLQKLPEKLQSTIDIAVVQITNANDNTGKVILPEFVPFVALTRHCCRVVLSQ